MNDRNNKDILEALNKYSNKQQSDDEKKEKDMIEALNKYSNKQQSDDEKNDLEKSIGNNINKEEENKMNFDEMLQDIYSGEDYEKEIINKSRKNSSPFINEINKSSSTINTANKIKNKYGMLPKLNPLVYDNISIKKPTVEEAFLSYLERFDKHHITYINLKKDTNSEIKALREQNKTLELEKREIQEEKEKSEKKTWIWAVIGTIIGFIINAFLNLFEWETLKELISALLGLI